MTSGNSTATLGKPKIKTLPKLPAQGVVRSKKALIFKMEGEQHILEKFAGPYLKEGATIRALGIEDCIFEGKHRLALTVEVPKKGGKPGEMEKFYVMKADVSFKPRVN